MYSGRSGEQIDRRAKSNLIFHLGQLESDMMDDDRDDELAIIESTLDRAVGSIPLRTEVVPPFMAILRDSPIEIIRDVVKALAEDTIKESDEDMAVSDTSMESTCNKSTRSGASDISMNSG